MPSPVKVGTVGFPVARRRLFERLDAVEAFQAFYQPPKEETVRRWREEAPKGFAFTLPAWQAITHPPTSPTFRKIRRKLPEKEKARLGHFRDSLLAREAWLETERLAEALDAKAVLFLTPPSFYPNADHLRDMYAFFKRVRRGPRVFAWEPRGGGWEKKTIEKVCRDLDLVHACDPTIRERLHGSFGYYRVHGAYRGRRVDYSHDFSRDELKRLLEAVEGGPSFVFFDNTSMWRSAQDFKDLADPTRVEIERMSARNKRRAAPKSQGIAAPGERRV